MIEQKDLHQSSYSITAQTYNQVCYRLSKNFVFFERNHLWQNDSVQVDVYGRFWTIGMTDTVKGQLRIKSKSAEHDFSGKHLAFIPPFSIIEWRIAKGIFNWCGYISKHQLPLGMPREPFAYPWNGNYFEKETQIHNFVRAAGAGIPLSKRETASRVAANIKKWIDENFQTELSFSDFAKVMGVSQAYLSKEFKLCFGISPQSYLNKLRAFEGMALIILNKANVGDASAQIGYADSSSFHHHFIQEFKARPSDFKEKAF